MKCPIEVGLVMVCTPNKTLLSDLTTKDKIIRSVMAACQLSNFIVLHTICHANKYENNYVNQEGQVNEGEIMFITAADM